MRCEAAATSTSSAREQLKHNVRALTQYLDEHAERQMTVFDNQRLDPIVGRVRVTVAPHLFVHTDGMPMRIWIDCSETLRESFLVSKCNVTLWAARTMRQSAAQVEVIHSATKRIVARGVLPPDFDVNVATACEVAHRVWTNRRRATELRR